MRTARIVGTGLCLPERVVTNHDLAAFMDTDDAWIRQRTGIVERRHVSEGETPATLAEGAARAALVRADLEPSDIDAIVLATLSPEHEFPGTSFFLHERLGVGEIPCMDLRAQCTGFLYALSVADAFAKVGRYGRILVVGCEVHSTGVEFNDRGRDVAVLFGDGAGAVVVESGPDDDAREGILEVRTHAEGRYARKLWVEVPGSSFQPHRIPPGSVEQGRAFPQMEGRFVFKHAVTRMPEVLLETLHAASVKLEDVDLFLFHQANLRINEYVAGQLGIPEEKCRNHIQRYGNCSAAAIPMLLAEADREGLLAPGKVVSMTAFGSGFSWGSAVVRF